MTMKQLVSLVLITLLLLTGCAAKNSPSDAEPTLDEQPVTNAGSASVTAVTPTATRIPMPSPTPTLTPFPESSVLEDVSVTASPTVTPAVKPAAKPKIEVVTAALRVRQGPGLDYPPLGTAQSGDQFEVEAVDKFGDWAQILFKGETGWISAHPNYTRLVDTETGKSPVVAVSHALTDLTVTPAVVSGSAKQENNLAGRLLFATRSGGELMSVKADGSDLRHLAGGVIDPVISPDGKEVAFTRWDGAEFGALYVINLESGDERVVASEIRQPKSPAWSPDGKKIVISFQHGGVRDPKRQCRTFRASEAARIPDNSQIVWVGMQPDGRVKICFIRNENLQWYLREINVDNGQFEDLPSAEYAYSPAWDPQNDWRVIYSGNRGLMQFDVNTRQQWPITNDLRDKDALFSPDGRKLAITYKQHDHWEIYTLDLESGVRQRLTKPPLLANPQYNSAAPVWSPDGTHLAFVTDRAGRWEIWVMGADGANSQPLLPPDVQSQLALDYQGVYERLLNWVE